LPQPLRPCPRDALPILDEAVTAACAYGFDHMGLDRISWRAHVGNLGSAAIARRAGFRYEGRMRLGATQRGARVDQWLAGRLASEDRKSTRLNSSHVSIS